MPAERSRPDDVRDSSCPESSGIPWAVGKGNALSSMRCHEFTILGKRCRGAPLKSELIATFRRVKGVMIWVRWSGTLSS
jgi:hypothetical protein